MKHNIAKKSLKKRLAYQFSFFVAIMMVLITVLVTFILKTALTRNLEMSLSINANNSMKSIEQRVSFLAESTKNFSKNHFIINSLIDPQGRVLYLPKLVQDFSTAQDVYAVTVVDFEGDAVYSSLDNPPDYRETINLRSALISGTPIFHLSENLKNIQIVEPIEYYQTPQGAVIVEFSIESIASRTFSRTLTANEEVNFYKLFSKKGILYLQKIEESKKYISIKKQAEKGSPYLAHMGIGFEMGVLKTKFLKPVRNAIIQLILIGFSFILVAVFIATKIGNSIAGPILQLCDRVIKAGVLEDEKCSPIGTGDELEELAQAFDNRTQQLIESKNNLEKQAIELKNFNEQLEQEIVERKQAEETLRESREKYRLLVNNIPSIVYKGYKDWSVDFFDEKIESLTGYDVDEFNSRRMKWIDIIVEEDIEVAREIFIQALKTDKSYIREYRIISKTGDINWIQEKGQIVCDNKGEIEYVNGVFFDITDHKQMQEELLKAKKLESVGILAGGIAHDFNNLLTIIIGNIELAKDDIKPEVGISECLEEAEKACIQAQALTKQLITFSKGGAAVKEIGSIEDILTKTINSIIANSNVRCDFFISHDLWRVEFDQVQMKHAINNLIVNAVESMPDGGLIKVRAENCIFSSEIADQILLLSEGNYVKISIRDHGVGIPEKHLSKIFDPYFSTKEMGIQKGMGLGLATTYSIINSHDGYITVESEVGVGTTFTLFLPAHEKDIRELKPIEILEPEKPSIRTGRILVMDDEESIRKLSKKRLSQLGYESELAKDGAQAIELYKKSMDSGQPFDLVILDLTVKGGMGGKEAIKFLQEINPQVKAIVSSGYSNDPVMTDFKAYGFTGALPKPNTKEDLIEALKKIIKK